MHLVEEKAHTEVDIACNKLDLAKKGYMVDKTVTSCTKKKAKDCTKKAKVCTERHKKNWIVNKNKGGQCSKRAR